MSDNKIVVEFSLQDKANSIEKTNDASKRLNATLEQTQKLTTGTQTGNRAAAASYSAAMGNQSYDIAKGTIGTGAGARDFAKESQGLGGLVRLYATYAANLFAAGAAFRALSDAADTSNMVKGLDQLGAASGKSLGSLSKQLTDAADGAISLRDAMTAVAQSSAAGMSSNDILRMGEVAKRASQALGVSMPDAISRLSRGITKLEPELLDELGIFTKINDSNEQYARQLGKTAASLTDFEKRQGFANAVLKEAENKFGKIQIDANPYDKLLASISNLSQKGLELVNTVLGPLVKLLSESPLALTAVIAGIAKMIIGQAIPAIGQWREAMKSAADDALLAVSGRSTAAKTAMTQRIAQAKIDAEALAEAAVTARDNATIKLEALSQQKFSQSKKRVTAILDKPVMDVTPEDLKYLDDHAQMNLATNKKLSESYKEVAQTIRDGQAAEKAFLVTDAALSEAKKRMAEGVKSSQIDDIKYRELSQAALLKSINATAAANAKELGFIASIKKGWEQVGEAKKGATLDVVVPGKFVKDANGKDLKVDGQKVPLTEKVAVEGIGKLQAAQGALGVVTAASASKLADFAGKLGTIGMAIGIAVAAFEILNTMFSNSAKQAEAYNKASSMLSTAIENVGKTLDALRAKNPDQILSIDSVQARANAFNELNQNLEKTTKAFEELGKAQNWWDRSIEGTQRFLSFFTGAFSEKLIGGGVKKQMADNLGGTIVAAIKATESGPARDKITKQLSELVGFDASTLDTKGVQEALNRLDFSDLQTKAEGAGRVIKTFANEANNSASTLTALQESLKQTGKDVDHLTSSLTPSDPLGKIGVDLISNSNKINTALKDPVNGLLALKAAVDDPKFLSLLPTDTSSDLLAAKAEIDGISEALGVAREKALKAREELQRLKDKGLNTTFQAAATKTAEWQLSEIEKRAKDVAAKYSTELAKGTFQAAFNYLEASLKNAMAEGALIAAKGYVSVLAGAGANTATLDKTLRDREFDIQAKLIDAQYAAKEAQERNTITLEKNNLLQELRLQTDKLAASAPGSKNFLDAEEKLKEITKNIVINENKSKILQNPTLSNIREIKGRKIEPGQEDLMQTAASQMSGYIATLYGKQAALAKIAGAREASNVQAMAEGYAKAAVEANKLLDTNIKNDNILLSDVTNQQALLGYYDQELANKKQDLELAILKNTAKKEENSIQANINTLEALAGKFDASKAKSAEDRKFLLNEELARTNALAQANKDMAATKAKALADERHLIINNKIATIDAIEKIDKRNREYNLEIKGYAKTISDARLTSQEDELNYKTQLGLITNEEAVKEKASIELAKQRVDYELQLATIKAKEAELEVTNKKILVMMGEGVYPTEMINQYNQDVDKLKGQRGALEAVNDQRVKAIKLNEELGGKMAGFSKIVEGAFQGMADALTTFVQTGKLDFKGLVDSMIADLIRFELRAQMSRLYSSLGGLSGIIGMITGTPAATGTDYSLSSGSTNLASMGGGQGLKLQAMGGAWDYGIQKFAMGGAFTNQIVNSPTLFKFAQGTGLMGEAGPEAIMPLKRDANGNLGVRSGQQQPNVDVVVNNYSNAQATTQETTDSRGNRRIEVTVGEMSAGDLSRSGSASQRTMRSTYGLQPQLIRR